MGWVEVLRGLHIVAGSLALVVFWVPLAVAKGSRWHRRVGWVFVAAMAEWMSTSGKTIMDEVIAAQAKSLRAQMNTKPKEKKKKRKGK